MYGSDMHSRDVLYLIGPLNSNRRPVTDMPTGANSLLFLGFEVNLNISMTFDQRTILYL